MSQKEIQPGQNFEGVTAFSLDVAGLNPAQKALLQDAIDRGLPRSEWPQFEYKVSNYDASRSDSREDRLVYAQDAENGTLIRVHLPTPGQPQWAEDERGNPVRIFPISETRFLGGSDTIQLQIQHEVKNPGRRELTRRGVAALGAVLLAAAGIGGRRFLQNEDVQTEIIPNHAVLNENVQKNASAEANSLTDIPLVITYTDWQGFIPIKSAVELGSLHPERKYVIRVINPGFIIEPSAKLTIHGGEIQLSSGVVEDSGYYSFSIIDTNDVNLLQPNSSSELVDEQQVHIEFSEKAGSDTFQVLRRTLENLESVSFPESLEGIPITSYNAVIVKSENVPTDPDKLKIEQTLVKAIQERVALGNLIGADIRFVGLRKTNTNSIIRSTDGRVVGLLLPREDFNGFSISMGYDSSKNPGFVALTKTIVEKAVDNGGGSDESKAYIDLLSQRLKLLNETFHSKKSSSPRRNTDVEPLYFDLLRIASYTDKPYNVSSISLDRKFDNTTELVGNIVTVLGHYWQEFTQRYDQIFSNSRTIDESKIRNAEKQILDILIGDALNIIMGRQVDQFILKNGFFPDIPDDRDFKQFTLFRTASNSSLDTFEELLRISTKYM